MPAENLSHQSRRGTKKSSVEPKKTVIDLRQLAQAEAPKVLEALVAMIESDSTPPTARIAAAKEILDRGFGRTPLATDAVEEAPQTPQGVIVLPAEIDE